MRKEDIILNFILSLFVAISAALIQENLKIDPVIIILATTLIIITFWLGSHIKDIDKRSKVKLPTASCGASDEIN